LGSQLPIVDALDGLDRRLQGAKPASQDSPSRASGVDGAEEKGDIRPLASRLSKYSPTPLCPSCLFNGWGLGPPRFLCKALCLHL